MCKDFFQLPNGVELLIPNGWKGSLGVRMFKGLDQPVHCPFHVIVLRNFWDSKIMGVELHSVGVPRASCGRDITLVAAVVVVGRANIPPHNPMLGPRPALSGCFID